MRCPEAGWRRRSPDLIGSPVSPLTALALRVPWADARAVVAAAGRPVRRRWPARREQLQRAPHRREPLRDGWIVEPRRRDRHRESSGCLVARAVEPVEDAKRREARARESTLRTPPVGHVQPPARTQNAQRL